MYNSIIINLIMAVVIRVQSLYKYSLCHKFFLWIKKWSKNIVGGSVLVLALRRLSQYYDNSFLIKLTDYVSLGIEKVITALINLKTKITRGSVLDSSVEYYTIDIKGYIKFVSALLVSLGVLVVIFTIKGNLVLPKLVSPVLILMGIAGLVLSSRTIDFICGSSLLSWIKNFYTLDTGDNQWW